MKKSVSYRRMVITAIVSSVLSVIIVLSALFLLVGRLTPSFMKIASMDFLVRKNHIDETFSDKIEDLLAEGYVSALSDEYAIYYSKDAANKKFDAFEGVKAGVGITIVFMPETYNFYVKRVIEGSPADKIGMKTGDVIFSVNGVAIDNKNYYDCYKELQGEIGKKVPVSYKRNGKNIEDTLILSDFIIQSVFTDKIDDYGYVEITTFNDKTVAQFKEKVNALIEEGVKGLIFNVADNGGGTLDSVIEILDFLLPEGVIVSVEYNDGVRKVIGKSDEKEIDLPMAVIINSSTASAAELFAASIRDYEKGAIIGEKSFGKGVMQKTYRLYDRSAIRFTVARYYSKNGVSYNKKGIEPDINVVLTKEQKMNYYFTSDRENPYVIKAVEYLNGK